MEKSVVFNNRLLPYLLLVPQLIITFVFFYWPASQAVWQSFLREDAFGLHSEFVGLENYQSLFADPSYYKSMMVTLVFSSLVAAAVSAMSCAPCVAEERLSQSPVGGSRIVETEMTELMTAIGGEDHVAGRRGRDQRTQ